MMVVMMTRNNDEHRRTGCHAWWTPSQSVGADGSARARYPRGFSTSRVPWHSQTEYRLVLDVEIAELGKNPVQKITPS